MNIPVLILAFNRPDLLLQCVSQFEKSVDVQIFLSIDGLPSSRPVDNQNVIELAKELLLAGRISQLRIGESNLGTLDGIIEGIDWFFSQVEFGLIIEDDLLISPMLFECLKLIQTTFLKNPNYGSVCFYDPRIQVNSEHENYLFRDSNLFSSLGWFTSSDKWVVRRKSFLELGTIRAAKVLLKSVPILSVPRYLIEISQNRKNELNCKPKCNWDLYWEFSNWEISRKNLFLNFRVVDHDGWGTKSTHNLSKPLYYKPLDSRMFEVQSFLLIDNNLKTRKIKDAEIVGQIRKFSGISWIKQILRIRTRLKNFTYFKL